MKSLVYLAAPYSSQCNYTIQRRFIDINRAAAFLFESYFVFSPISHTHPIKECSSLKGNWEFWSDYDFKMISVCDELVVLMLQDWEFSTGVNAELKIAKELGKPIRYMNPITNQLLAAP